MTNILAIDTSTPACSVAVQHGAENEVVTQHKLASREHTKLILPMVDQLLAEAGIGLSQIDVIAFTAGPGSFTGIRIGFGVVQGLAFGADIPVLPVSSLETLAYTAVRKMDLATNMSKQIAIVPMLDARMDEIYWSQFQLSDSTSEGKIQLERLCSDHLSSPEDIASILKCTDLKSTELKSTDSSSVIIVGDGCNYGERLSLTTDTTNPSLLPDAQDILTIAQPLLATDRVISIDQASPVYLRDKITWKKRQRLRSSSVDNE